MTVRLVGQRVVLEGVCRVDEAETLVRFLQEGAVEVDVGACEAIHAAVFQALLALSPALTGEAADRFLKDLAFPALRRATEATNRERGAKEDRLATLQERRSR